MCNDMLGFSASDSIWTIQSYENRNNLFKFRFDDNFVDSCYRQYSLSMTQTPRVSVIKMYASLLDRSQGQRSFACW
jgi:hypothetical protein